MRNERNDRPEEEFKKEFTEEFPGDDYQDDTDEEVVFDEADDADDGLDDETDASAAVDKLKKIKKKLKEAEKEKAEYLDGWQRAKAELVNFQRQMRADEERRVQAAAANVLERLLPVVDSFDMAMKGGAWQNVDKNWRIGVEQICSQLKSVLREHGVEEESPLGEAFDPNRHESLSVEETNDKKKDGTVAAVIQKGYTMRGTLIRPAKVVVAEYKESD